MQRLDPKEKQNEKFVFDLVNSNDLNLGKIWIEKTKGHFISDDSRLPDRQLKQNNATFTIKYTGSSIVVWYTFEL